MGACAFLIACVLAAPASAQDTDAGTSAVTADQYGDRAAQLQSGGNEASAGEASSASAGVGPLPFTGLDLALMGAVATSLLVGGAVMRRRVNSGQES